MNEIELGEYFEQFSFRILYLNNFVDYEDIENPIKTFQNVKDSFDIGPNKAVFRTFNYQKHTFMDNIWRF